MRRISIYTAVLLLSLFSANSYARLKGQAYVDSLLKELPSQKVAGIVGVKKFAYDIWGDTVNTAACMEQHSEAGKINISQTTYELLKDTFSFECRGEVQVKGKGSMNMYFVC